MAEHDGEVGPGRFVAGWSVAGAKAGAGRHVDRRPNLLPKLGGEQVRVPDEPRGNLQDHATWRGRTDGREQLRTDRREDEGRRRKGGCGRSSLGFEHRSRLTSGRRPIP